MFVCRSIHFADMFFHISLACFSQLAAVVDIASVAPSTLCPDPTVGTTVQSVLYCTVRMYLCAYSIVLY